MELLETPFYEWGMPVCEAVQELLLDEQKREPDAYQEIREWIARRIMRHKLVHERLQGMDYLYRAIAKTGGKLAGCDIKKNLPRLEDVIEENHPESRVESQDAVPQEEESGYLDSYDRYRKRLAAYIQTMNPLRERTMGERCVDYVGKRTVKKPIIAIIGSHHARPDSRIYSILEIAGVRWKTIVQEDEKSLADDDEYVLQLGLR